MACRVLDRVWRNKSTEVEGMKVRSKNSAKEGKLARKRSGLPSHKDWLATRGIPGFLSPTATSRTCALVATYLFLLSPKLHVSNPQHVTFQQAVSHSIPNQKLGGLLKLPLVVAQEAGISSGIFLELLPGT